MWASHGLGVPSCRISNDQFSGTIKRLDWVLPIDQEKINYMQRYCEPEEYSLWDEGKKWLIELEPFFEVDGAGICEIIYVNITFMSESKTNVIAGIYLTTVNEDGRVIKNFATDRPHNFLRERRFHHKCHFDVSYETLAVHCTIEQMDSSKVMAINKTAVTDDYGRLFESGTHSDIILSVDGHVLKAHKAILSARSEVFYAMFEHQMLENKSNLVTITDLQLDVVKEMLHFIYTGNSPKIAEMTFELLNAAEKYALMDLRNMCETTKETAAEMEVIADRYNIEALKKYAIKFMSPDENDKTNAQPENDVEIPAKRQRSSSASSDSAKKTIF